MESVVGDCGVLHKPEVVGFPGEICSGDVLEGHSEERSHKEIKAVEHRQRRDPEGRCRHAKPKTRSRGIHVMESDFPRFGSSFYLRARRLGFSLQLTTLSHSLSSSFILSLAHLNVSASTSSPLTAPRRLMHVDPC